MPLILSSKENIKYKYKKFEKFKFDTFDIEAERPISDNISIDALGSISGVNKIPIRKNFIPEMKVSVDEFL